MLDSLYRWQISVIRGLQSFQSPGLDGFFRGLSWLGEDVGYLFLLTVLWVAVRPKPAARTAIVLFLSFWLNSLLKELLGQPRPFELGGVQKLVHETSNGIPSGHAQSSLLFWGMMVGFFPSVRWLRGLAVALVLGIALSRVYLGVHFPTDILGAWAVAAGLLWLYWRGETGFERVLGQLSPRSWVRFAGVFCALGLFVHRSPTSAAALGALFGTVAGLALEAARGGTQAGTAPSEARSPGLRVFHTLMALCGCAVLYLGLKSIFPAEGEPGWLFFRFARYAAIGFWVAAGTSAVFRLEPAARSTA